MSPLVSVESPATASSPVDRKGSRPSRRCFFLSLVFFALAGCLAIAVYPCFRAASYTLDGAEPVRVSWPFNTADSPAGYLTWKIPLECPLWKPGALSLYGSGRVYSMMVNGHNITFSPPRTLDTQSPTRIPLDGLLHSGVNHLEFRMEKAQGRITLRPFPFLSDPPYLTLLGTILVGCGFLLAGMHFRLPAFLPAALAVVLFAGIALRVLYTAGTIYSARSYDAPGHVEYIKYVASHGSLPAVRQGWETHQPPLYYLLCAALMRAVGMGSSSFLYLTWQLFSLLLAVGAFLFCYPICLRLLGSPKGKAIPHVLFLAVLAFYPGFVFSSSRVSNDSLFNFFAFLWFWLVLRAWQEPDLRNWIWVSLCAGVGVLTKNTMLPLLAVTACLIIALPRVTLGRKAWLLGVLTAAVLLIAGWYQFPRLAISDNPADFIVANNDMGPNLRLPCSLDRIATFNPAAVVEIPFHNPWKDETRRMYFAEAFFKTSLFGEWAWGSHLLLPGRALVVSAMALLLCVAAGLVRWLRCRDANSLPICLTAGAVVGSVLLYFWRLPFACNQDFRFAVLVLVALAYWIAKCSIRRSYVATVAVFFFCVNTILFLTVLMFV